MQSALILCTAFFLSPGHIGQPSPYVRAVLASDLTQIAKLVALVPFTTTRSWTAADRFFGSPAGVDVHGIGLRVQYYELAVGTRLILSGTLAENKGCRYLLTSEIPANWTRFASVRAPMTGRIIGRTIRKGMDEDQVAQFLNTSGEPVVVGLAEGALVCVRVYSALHLRIEFQSDSDGRMRVTSVSYGNRLGE